LNYYITKSFKEERIKGPRPRASRRNEQNDQNLELQRKMIKTTKTKNFKEKQVRRPKQRPLKRNKQKDYDHEFER
jgi:hypothetical protein